MWYYLIYFLKAHFSPIWPFNALGNTGHNFCSDIQLIWFLSIFGIFTEIFSFQYKFKSMKKNITINKQKIIVLTWLLLNIVQRTQYGVVAVLGICQYGLSIKTLCAKISLISWQKIYLTSEKILALDKKNLNWGKSKICNFFPFLFSKWNDLLTPSKKQLFRNMEKNIWQKFP